MTRKFGEQPGDGIQRAILTVLALSLIAGVLLAILAEYHFHSPELGTAGAGLALVSGALYLFFRLLGRREMRRRQQQGRAEDDERAP